ncbi:MAG TPA: hypothetical protein VGM76_04050 [Lacipirellulaceae bacterium]|jgi:hypothetical protein
MKSFTSRPRCGRAGISILEFIGCLCALVGGAWLGALYLGVDVRHVAYVALKDSQLLDRVPEKWRPLAPDVKQGADAPTPEQLARHVEDELVALRQEITALRTSRDASPDASGKPEPAAGAGTLPSKSASVKTLSLAYWTRLCDIVRDETALQADSESAATQSNATQVAALKSRVCRFASSAIQAIPTEGVDPAATEFGKQLAQWYDHGGDLYEEAVRIWESPARGQDGHPLTDAWNETKAQHANEERLMNERGAVVRDSLVRRFGDEFAALTKM